MNEINLLELNKILSSTIQLRCVHLYLMWPVIQKITYVFAIWPISCGTTTQPVIWKYMLCYLVRTCQQFGVGAPWFYQYCYISNNSKFLLCADHNVFLYKHSSLKRIIELLLMIFHFWIGILFYFVKLMKRFTFNYFCIIYLVVLKTCHFFSIIIYVFIFGHIIPAEYLSICPTIVFWRAISEADYLLLFAHRHHLLSLLKPKLLCAA